MNTFTQRPHFLLMAFAFAMALAAPLAQASVSASDILDTTVCKNLAAQAQAQQN